MRQVHTLSMIYHVWPDYLLHRMQKDSAHGLPGFSSFNVVLQGHDTQSRSFSNIEQLGFVTVSASCSVVGFTAAILRVIFQGVILTWSFFLVVHFMAHQTSKMLKRSRA